MDGAPLVLEVHATIPAASPVSRDTPPLTTAPPAQVRKSTGSVDERPGRSRTTLIVVATAVAVAVVGAGGFFLYWKGYVGDRQGSVASSLTAAAAAKGYAAVAITVDKDWVATVGGAVVGQTARDDALALARTDPSIAAVVDRLEVKASQAEVQDLVTDALTANGFGTVQSVVAADYRATLSGSADSQEQKESILVIVRAVPGVVDVVDQIGRSTAWRQEEFNRMLATAGFPRVWAGFGNQIIVLNGSVESAGDRDRLDQFARENAPDMQLRSYVFVEPPRPTAYASTGGRAPPTPAELPPPAEPAVPPVAQIGGLWIARVRSGLLSYTVDLRIKKGSVGEVVGESLYSAGNDRSAMCAGRLTLVELTETGAVLSEEVTRIALFCPAGGTVIMQMRGGAAAYLEWYRRKNPDKVAMKGYAERR